jgi:uroporphyrinogen decarboxylase
MTHCPCVPACVTSFHYRPDRKVSGDGRDYIVGGLLRERSDLGMIKLGNPKDEMLYDEVKRFVDRNGKKYAVFAATNIGLDPLLLGMGLDNFAYALIDDPGLIDEILDIYTDWTSEVVIRLQKAGVDMIWFTDDIAFNTSLMFSPDFFKEIAKPKLKKVMDNVKIPSLFHSDGYILPVMDDLIELGVNGIHPMDPCALDIEKVKQQYGNRVCLVGNIDLRYTLVNATAEEVRQEVKQRIEKIGYNGGYIISSANTITRYCRNENILAMRDAILEYGAL